MEETSLSMQIAKMLFIMQIDLASCSIKYRAFQSVSCVVCIQRSMEQNIANLMSSCYEKLSHIYMQQKVITTLISSSLHKYILRILSEQLIDIPVSPRLSVDWPSRNCSGRTPIPTRLDRWILSKLSAITALTPYRYRVYA